MAAGTEAPSSSTPCQPPRFLYTRCGTKSGSRMWPRRPNGHPFLAVHGKAVHRRGVHLVRLGLRRAEQIGDLLSRVVLLGYDQLHAVPPVLRAALRGPSFVHTVAPNWFINVCGDGARRARGPQAGRGRADPDGLHAARRGQAPLLPARGCVRTGGRSNCLAYTIFPQSAKKEPKLFPPADGAPAQARAEAAGGRRSACGKGGDGDGGGGASAAARGAAARRQKSADAHQGHGARAQVRAAALRQVQHRRGRRTPPRKRLRQPLKVVHARLGLDGAPAQAHAGGKGAGAKTWRASGDFVSEC